MTSGSVLSWSRTTQESLFGFMNLYDYTWIGLNTDYWLFCKASDVNMSGQIFVERS